MSYDRNWELYWAIEKLEKYCDTIDEELKREKEPLFFKHDRIREEMKNFVSYLSASDGIIANVEAEFLYAYLFTRKTADELREYIDKNNTYTRTFEQTVPQTFMDFVRRDNAVFAESGKLDNSYSLAYCNLFECLAKEFLACDGDVAEEEVKNMTIYLSMLKNYRKKNYKGPKDAPCEMDVDQILTKGNYPKALKTREARIKLNKLLAELNELVGLKTVKKDVESLIHLKEISRLRRLRGLKEIPVSNHLVFCGNPGTGKTTVARLLAKIYHAMGLLSKGNFVEVDRSGLVGEYLGQTAVKVQQVVKKALGGVLFIDEAYSLAYSKEKDFYGQEAIDTLIKAMEDNREDLIVIVAGYPELMAQFINSNPGLSSRFNKYINFEDYNGEELMQIYESMCKNAGYTTADEAKKYVAEVFEAKYQKRDKNFANAREVRNFFEKAIVKQADRLFGVRNPTNEELSTLLLDDVQ